MLGELREEARTESEFGLSSESNASDEQDALRAIRSLFSGDYSEMSDESIDQVISESLSKMSPDEVESFWKTLGGAVKHAVPVLRTALPIAGGVVGTIYGGPAGGAIGAQVGGLAGQAVGGAATHRRSAPTPVGARLSAARTRVKPAFTKTPPKATASAGSLGTGSSTISQLLSLLQSPALHRAILGKALGTVAKPRTPAGKKGATIPFGALMNALSHLANKAAEDVGHDESSDSDELPDYLFDTRGNLLADPASPAERAAIVLEHLRQSTEFAGDPMITEKYEPYTRVSVDNSEVTQDSQDGEFVLSQDLVQQSDLESSDSGPFLPDHTDVVEWLAESGLNGTSLIPEAKILADERWSGDDYGSFESGPATIDLSKAALDLRMQESPVAAAGLGLAVFNTGVSVLGGGDFKFSSTPANYTHEKTPPYAPLDRMSIEFKINAWHPRLLARSPDFWFRLTFEYNGNDIKAVKVTRLVNKSSGLVQSKFSINFAPTAYSLPADPVAEIRYVISGRWDPKGTGDVSYEGYLNVSANGRVSIKLDSEKNWVEFKGFYNKKVVRLSSPNPPIPVVRPLYFHTVHFSPAGSARVRNKHIREMKSFIDKLPSKILEKVIDGTQPIELDAYASTTSSVSNNQTLARKRARNVQVILRDLVGENAQFRTRVHGELDPKTRDNVEDPKERRVVIWI